MGLQYVFCWAKPIEVLKNNKIAVAPIEMESHFDWISLFFLLQKSDPRSSFFTLEKEKGDEMLEMDSGKWLLDIFIIMRLKLKK